MSAEWNAHALNVTLYGRKEKNGSTQVLAWVFKTRMFRTLGFKGQTIRVMSYRLHVYVRISLRHWTGKWQWMQLNQIVWVIAETWKRGGIFYLISKTAVTRRVYKYNILGSYSLGSTKTLINHIVTKFF